MADVTIYKPASVTVQVVDGPPPDLSVLQTQVDALTAQLATANSTIAVMQAKIDNARTAAQADKAADDARESGQSVLDALA